jgi:galactokinase
MPHFLDRLRDAFTGSFHAAPAFIARAPGRVNLLGEHVDYNAGWVLPAAIDRAAYLAVGACPSPLVSLSALDLDDGTTFRVTELDARAEVSGKPLKDWARYPAGVAWSLRGRGLRVNGMDAVLASDVPRGAGLSSSAAVEVVFATAWQTLGGWDLPPMELALACQRAENEYVGVNCGIMDQFASACGRAGAGPLAARHRHHRGRHPGAARIGPERVQRSPRAVRGGRARTIGSPARHPGPA